VTEVSSNISENVTSIYVREVQVWVLVDRKKVTLNFGWGHS
jgi:hypothetical protein